MPSNFALNWAVLAVSIFNTILLLWLGLTVLLNSEHRSLGVWVAGSGLLLSGLFFLSHTAILGIGPFQPDLHTNLWWRTGWVPVVSMPYAWYLVMLWYSSYWDDPQNSIHQRHQIPLILATLLALSTIGLVFLSNSLPTYTQVVQLDLAGVLSIGGIPILMLVYPVYLLMCIGFSLDALLHPGRSVRLMGQLARQRARPWLLASTISLLVASLFVGFVIIWGIYRLNQQISPPFFTTIITAFDLVIDLLLAVTILSLGQAIISYEVFTGKILPRQGLKQYWKWAIVLAFGFGLMISWALLYQLEPIYLLLLSILLTTGIYAILGWRSFTEQEHYLRSLHPFITSQHLYDQLIIQESSSYDNVISNTFHALCRDILEVKQGFLLPMGIFSPLVGGSISYPASMPLQGQEQVQEEIRHILAENIGFAPFLLPESSLFGHNPMAISLWSERGLIGLLILGDKKNSSLFTQEEIEVARTVGERLIDSKASNELAHRLMELERQHLSETRVVDQQTRRGLHDEILPRLQALMIKLSSGSAKTEEAVAELGEIHHQLTSLMHALPVVVEPEISRRGLIEALQATIDNDYCSYFNTLTWHIDQPAIENARLLTPFSSTVLYHAAREAVRNAAVHGRQSECAQPLNLSISMSWQDGLLVKIQDDGIGFDPALYDGGNHEHGLALHSTLMAVVGGSLAVDSIPNKSTQVILKLPAYTR